MSIKIDNSEGSIIIDNNVVSTIAGISAMESYGIVGMASKNATDGLFELLKWDYMSKGVQVNTEGGKMVIDLHVILEFGVKISVVASNIMERVKFNVENLTGLEVDKINVLVQGIRVQK